MPHFFVTLGSQRDEFCSHSARVVDEILHKFSFCPFCKHSKLMLYEMLYVSDRLKMEEMKLYLSVNFFRYLGLKNLEGKVALRYFLFETFTWLSQKVLALSNWYTVLKVILFVFFYPWLIVDTTKCNLIFVSFSDLQNLFFYIFVLQVRHYLKTRPDVNKDIVELA